MITRFIVLPDERCLLLGVDKNNIFEKGVVYEVVKILDEIVLKPIGKSALPNEGYGGKFSTANEIVTAGMHLFTLEEKENLQW